MPIQNSERRTRYRTRSAPTSIRVSTAFAMIPASAAFGTSASRSAKNSSTPKTTIAPTALGIWLLVPALSIAAVREALEPVAQAPLSPAATFAAPKANICWLASSE
jgi:hypothetical protein